MSLFKSEEEKAKTRAETQQIEADTLIKLAKTRTQLTKEQLANIELAVQIMQRAGYTAKQIKQFLTDQMPKAVEIGEDTRTIKTLMNSGKFSISLLKPGEPPDREAK